MFELEYKNNSKTIDICLENMRKLNKKEYSKGDNNKFYYYSHIASRLNKRNIDILNENILKLEKEVKDEESKMQSLSMGPRTNFRSKDNKESK